MVPPSPGAFTLHRGKRKLRQAGRTRDNARMDIVLNGESRHIEPKLTIAGLLQSEGLAERRVAVEINGEIVPRGLHPTRQLAPGDRIEIVHALGGG